LAGWEIRSYIVEVNYPLHSSVYYGLINLGISLSSENRVAVLIKARWE